LLKYILSTISVGKFVSTESQGDIMDKFQAYAIGHHLSEWPSHFSYEDIVRSLMDDDFESHITVHEVYELYPGGDVVQFIIDMVQGLKERFK
jgi:hypothetical protein